MAQAFLATVRGLARSTAAGCSAGLRRACARTACALRKWRILDYRQIAGFAVTGRQLLPRLGGICAFREIAEKAVVAVAGMGRSGSVVGSLGLSFLNAKSVIGGARVPNLDTLPGVG